MPKHVNDIVSCLLQALQSSYDMQRAVSAAIFAEVTTLFYIVLVACTLLNFKIVKQRWKKIFLLENLCIWHKILYKISEGVDLYSFCLCLFIYTELTQRVQT